MSHRLDRQVERVVAIATIHRAGQVARIKQPNDVVAVATIQIRRLVASHFKRINRRATHQIFKVLEAEEATWGDARIAVAVCPVHFPQGVVVGSSQSVTGIASDD